LIVSFRDPVTEALYHGRKSRRVHRLPPDVLRITLRKLDMLAAAADLTDLRSPPGNRLEALRGDLKGLHSIRINQQWRLVFRWTSAGPEEVGILDYH
jgi:toxin HigB-1